MKGTERNYKKPRFIINIGDVDGNRKQNVEMNCTIIIGVLER